MADEDMTTSYDTEAIDGAPDVTGDLDEVVQYARRDDWHRHFVGSDIRQLIGRCKRAEAERDAAKDMLAAHSRVLYNGVEIMQEIIGQMVAEHDDDWFAPSVFKRGQEWIARLEEAT